MGARRQYGAVLALKQVTAFSYSAHAVSQSGRNLNDIALVFRALAAARMHSSPSACFFCESAVDIARKRSAPRREDLHGGPFRFIPPKTRQGKL